MYKSSKSSKSRNLPSQIRKRLASLRRQIRKRQRVDELLRREITLREQLERLGKP